MMNHDEPSNAYNVHATYYSVCNAYYIRMPVAPGMMERLLSFVAF